MVRRSINIEDCLRIVAIVRVRMNSTRLIGKVLMDLLGRLMFLLRKIRGSK